MATLPNERIQALDVLRGFAAVVSPLWLRRFRYGPMEWLWRCATGWRWMPLRLREVRATT
jgi:uncharacterized membrane protein YeiB